MAKSCTHSYRGTVSHESWGKQKRWRRGRRVRQVGDSKILEEEGGDGAGSSTPFSQGRRGQEGPPGASPLCPAAPSSSPVSSHLYLSVCLSGGFLQPSSLLFLRPDLKSLLTS